MPNPTHLFNDAIYLIRSSVVARNLLFYSEALVERFLEKLDVYLSPLCEILHFNIYNHGFALIIVLKDREHFCRFYRNKHSLDDIAEKDIPFSSHIFSKAMSDLLVSTVKHFNYHHGRKGSLVASRFKRTMIQSEEELEFWLNKMDEMILETEYKAPWDELPSRYKVVKERRKRKKVVRRCAPYWKRNENVLERTSQLCGRNNSMDLRGCFQKATPNSIYDIYHRISITFYIPLPLKPT